MDLQKSGKLIAEKRKELQLTQKQLGNAVGVSDKAVSKWERGLSFPDIGIVETLARTLGISLAELIGGEAKQEVPVQTEMLLKDVLRLSLRSFAERKKRQIVVVFSVLAVLVPLVCLWAFIVQPVDGTGKTDSVDAQAFPSGNVLSLPIRTRVNYGDFYAFGDMYFKSDLLKAEMEEKLIVWFGEEQVQERNGSFLIAQPDQLGHTDFYLLQFRGLADGKKQYNWTGMRMTLVGAATQTEILVPLYLFDDSRICLRDTTFLVSGAQYEVCETLVEQDIIPHKQTAVTPQVWQAFYEKTGWFTTQADENVLTVTPTVDCPEQQAFTITFTVHEEQFYCSFALKQ